MKQLKRNIKKILVVRNDRFGEFLLNIPALRALRETFKQAEIIAVISPELRELAQDIPFIDEVIPWGNKEHVLSEKLRLIKLLRSRNIDLAIMLVPSKEFNIMTYLAGIPTRIGYDRKYGFLLSAKIKDQKHLAQRHEVEYNLELVGLIGAATSDKTLFLSVNNDIDAAACFGLNGLVGEKLVILHPWTSDPIKQWPIDYFYELAQRLLSNPEIKLAIIGGSDEAGRGIVFSDRFGQDKLLNLVGKTSLRQLAGVLKKSCLLISGDSGPAHLASAVGTPALVIFRNDILGKGAKRWGPWLAASRVIESGNLSDVTVNQVYAKAMEMI